MSVLLLQLFEPLGLIHPQTTVFLPPTVVGLLGHADLLTGLGDVAALRLVHLRLTQLGDDLFRCESLLGHCLHPFRLCPKHHSITLAMDSV